MPKRLQTPPPLVVPVRRRTYNIDMRTTLTRLGLAAAALCFVGVAIRLAKVNQPDACVSVLPAASNLPGNAVYVWQHHWSPAVLAGIEQASTATDVFMVLGAELTLNDGRLRSRTPNADWRVFAATIRPVWVVLRIHELPDIRSAEGRTASAETLANVTRQLLDDMSNSRAQPSGVQVDYDCATENLGHYASLLRLFREQLPEAAVSITTLPAWFGQPEFANLLAGVDHYILQVHSLEKPARPDDPVALCDTSRVPGWLEQAESLGVPFYLALPTYGYRLSFGADGEFVGLNAEESEESWEGCTTREVMADPVAIAGLVRTLKARPPSFMLGFAWFRLPVEGDRLNWSWPLLEKVVAGQAPEPELRAEVRSPSENLYEVWVTNMGMFRPMEPIQIPVDWISGSGIAHDALSGFQFNTASAEAGNLVGKAPAPGEESLAAWFRMVPADGNQAMALRVGDVEVLR